MSYAAVAASGPAQPDSEKVPHALPEIAHDDTDVHSLDTSSASLDGIQVVEVGGVNSMPSYADQQLAEEQRTAAEREAQEAEERAAAEAKQFKEKAEQESKRLAKEAETKAKQAEKKASEKLDEAKDKASTEYSKAKKEIGAAADKAEVKAQKAEQWADNNKRNPVVVGNAVVITALAGLLGVGAYRLHKAHALTWKVAGAWAGAVGLFAVGDYFVSSYLFKRYPPK